MNYLRAKDIPMLFNQLSQVFAMQKETLIKLDGAVGDSDLGLTMAKGFSAANDALGNLENASIEMHFKTAGVAMARAAPSTMGTLIATGLMRGANTAKEKNTLGTAEIANFWRAFCDGIAQRGRAKLGDKTVVDILEPIAVTLTKQAEIDANLSDALMAAHESAIMALEETKNLVAQLGKAAAFQEKTRGLQDAGGTVAVILIKTMAEFVREN